MFVLRWLSAPAKTYTLETRSDLISGQWDVLAATLLGNGFVQEFPISGSAQSNRFYRLRLHQ